MKQRIVLDTNCLIASYIVSEDSHFKEVARSEFPHLDVIRLRNFLEMLTPETRGIDL